MPFKYSMRPYTKEEVDTLHPNQLGVYGIFRDEVAIYISSCDLRQRLLGHLNRDNHCISRNLPNQWTAELIQGDPTQRMQELIQEYRLVCNEEWLD